MFSFCLAIVEPADSTDECSTSPCQNEGTCVDRYNDYLCLCPAGYSGNTCQTGGNKLQLVRPAPQSCRIDYLSCFVNECREAYKNVCHIEIMLPFESYAKEFYFCFVF